MMSIGARRRSRKLTDAFIAEVDEILHRKEKEILEI